jgi:phosphotransferase system  glucose/maltose/N-acetylglucosamine-specific IIC component
MGNITSSVEGASNAAVKGGTTSSVFFGGAGLTPYMSDVVSVIGVLIGLVIAFMGYKVNQHYKEKQDKREEEYHKARMRALKDD